MPTMNFRCTDKQKNDIEKKAEEYGFNSVGAYIKFTSINAKLSVEVTNNEIEEKIFDRKDNAEIEKKIKLYKQAYIDNYTHFTSQTIEALLMAKDALCDSKPNKENVFIIIDKISKVSGSNKSKKQALRNEEKYVFEIIELFRD